MDEGSGENRMTATALDSVRSLLASVVDYAGLFPPAQLDMERTVRNYAAYLRSPEEWMLGRLIVPVARLEEFEERVQAGGLLPRGEDLDAPQWQISAITAAAAETEQLAADLEAIEAFNLRHGEETDAVANIDMIELKAATSADINSALDQIPHDLFPFFELPIERDPRGLIAALVEGDAGAKVRTGGTAADAYPTPEHLARFINACAAANVPFKATAGLHHPLRHHSEGVKTQEFGFLNVFIAGCMAHVQEASVQELMAILSEENSPAFTFDGYGVSWREYRLSNDEVEEARDAFAISFGSCSFEEPIEHLRSMNLL
jgi:hypothetical protein